MEEHVTEAQEQIDVPAIVLDPSPAVQAEEAETETDVTINVETVEPVPFSETSSVASPVPAHVQPTAVAHAPEPVEALGHTEPLRMHEDSAKDHGVVQDAVPVVQAEPATVEPIAASVPLVEDPLVKEPAAVEEPAAETAESKEKQEELPPAPESVVLSGETPGPAVALSTSEPVTIAQAVAAAEDELEVSGDVMEAAHPKSNGSAMLTDSIPGSAPEPELESSSSALEDGDASSQDNVPIAAKPAGQPEASASDDSNSAAPATTPPASD
jgi:hypothetical protein